MEPRSAVGGPRSKAKVFDLAGVVITHFSSVAGQSQRNRPRTPKEPP